VPNSRAATAAYAESVTDGVPDEMRRALFDALWNDHRRVDDPDVIRSIVSAVLDPKPLGDFDARLRSNQPLVPLGDPNVLAISRRLGFTVSMGRGPLTLTGQRRIDSWRRLWQDNGTPQLPLLLTGTDEALSGDRALRWLADRLPQRALAEPKAQAPGRNLDHASRVPAGR
jgi:hypothetical protein